MVRLILYQHIGISLIARQLWGSAGGVEPSGWPGDAVRTVMSSFILTSIAWLIVYFFSFNKTFTPTFYFSFLHICQECSISFLSDCLPTCLSMVCLPLAVVLAPIADALIGIRRSARDLIQKGVSAGCLETDLASKALHGIKPSISVLSATCGQIAKELWKLLSEA